MKRDAVVFNAYGEEVDIDLDELRHTKKEGEPLKEAVVGVPDENGNVIISVLRLPPQYTPSEIKRQQRRRS